MNAKYIIFEGIYGYSKYVFNDLQNDVNCFFAKTTFESIIGKINLFHTSEKANRYINLPLKSIWYNKYMDKIPNDSGEQWIVIFAEGCRLAYDSHFINKLRKRYNKLKIVYYFLNSTVQLSDKRINYINTTFDIVVSYDRADCKKYDWYYYCGIYCADNTPDEIKNEELTDVFFVGRDKGRLEDIHKAYKLFVISGLKCDFYVIDVPKEKQTVEGIHYNEFLPYNETLKKVRRTRILYEIVQKEQTGCTFRTYEAILYHKILVSNNIQLQSMRIYDSQNMILYKNITDIDVNALLQCTYVEMNTSQNILSPYFFLDFLEGVINNESISK